MTGPNGEVSPAPALVPQRKRSWLGISLTVVAGSLLLFVAVILWRLSELPPAYKSVAVVAIQEDQNDEMFRWVKVTLGGPELKRRALKTMATRHPEIVLTDVRIGTRFGREPQTLYIAAVGRGADAQSCYLDVVLDELLLMREESQVRGDLRILEHSCMSIELQRFSVKDWAERMADRVILGE